MGKHSGKYNAQAVISISIMFETERSSEMPYLLRLKWVLSEYPPPPSSGPLPLPISPLLCTWGHMSKIGFFPAPWTSEHLLPLNYATLGTCLVSYVP